MNLNEMSIQELNALNKDTLMQSLGIEYLEVKSDFVKAKMPVDKRTLQPMGILHGGANIALAETIASLGSAKNVDLNQYDVRGASVTSNHLGAVARGSVYAEGRLIHKGRITHVWDVEVKDQGGYIISVTRVTVIVIPRLKD